MLNSVSLTGRLTRDVDLRYTQSGTAAGSFTLAVDRKFKSKNGERETDFVNCQIWRKSAENFANFTKKGSLVGVEGRIQTRTYDNAQGQKIFVTEVIVDNFALLESRQTSQNSPKSQQTVNASAAATTNASQTTPNASRANTTDPFANNGQPIDIQDDDLPF
ncbi:MULTISPECIES: single-stranded DNA-binding protein [Lactobacillaceae]|uniref:single-stranded DNA-binding protein n=1 Tax=Lactobacillaceae TaxID=33958 RepID=UPI000235A284|nr:MULTISPECIES: single-stranded DNA-binding protein [Lactobacillaceae]AGP70882.1 Single-stranded DNA-binding protein [Lacticaseibacillus rhamnosus LOCK900]EHJ20787.1 single-stranded DNA-binding protein [Lacticaseibacillus rhamnosus R0011]EHJ31973.1 single-strand binding family protein [Lacticaseibacillus rhamnosus ATCC 21052]KIX27680.1 single-stranded DNA-binding protein [Lacticaseibacillus rhamnosus]KMO58246.1 single-stranded DNA-binding protein [Lacticaseibacillus rhamnosus]